MAISCDPCHMVAVNPLFANRRSWLHGHPRVGSENDSGSTGNLLTKTVTGSSACDSGDLLAQSTYNYGHHDLPTSIVQEFDDPTVTGINLAARMQTLDYRADGGTRQVNMGGKRH
jgi:hypothetical protein